MRSCESIDFICPRCQGLLEDGKEAFLCKICGSSWYKVNRIPVFRKCEDFYYTGISKQNTQRLMHLSKELGWRKATEEMASCSNDREGFIRAVTDEKRVSWRYLLNIAADSTFLDYGSGFGVASICLSRICRLVVSMDLILERLQFLMSRAEQENIYNIIPVCAGDLPYLPFPDSIFDYVVLNGVLEWIPLSREGDPLEIQRESLKEIHRVLKNRGILYIGIENRYGINFLLGDPDPHSKLPYGNVLPRRAAKFYSKWVKGSDFRTYTHSRRGYSKLLIKSGFQDVQFFWPYPDYRDFSEIVNIEDRKEFNSFITKNDRSPNRSLLYSVKRLLKMTLINLGFYKNLVPCFSILAVADKGVDRRLM